MRVLSVLVPTCRRQYPAGPLGLIARGTAYSNRFPVPSGGGLPHHCARSATTLDFSRPARRSLALRPVGSPSRQSDPSFSKAPTVSFPPRVASIATGWSDPVAGWDLHPLETNTFHTAHTRSDTLDGRRSGVPGCAETVHANGSLRHNFRSVPRGACCDQFEIFVDAKHLM